MVLTAVFSHRANRNVGNRSCSFNVVNNMSFIDEVYSYIGEDSHDKQIEYIIRLSGVGTADWQKKLSTETFEPSRLFIFYFNIFCFRANHFNVQSS